MGKALSDLATAVLVGCALLVTGLMVKQEFGRGPADTNNSRLEAVPVDDWEKLSAVGHRRGPADAPVRILVFADFECPVCAQFAIQALHPVLDQYEDEVLHIHRHWPLDYHRFARPAAVAVECAAKQSGFFALHDVLLEKQDSLGLKSFDEFAREAGVPDIAAFRSCMDDPGQFGKNLDDDVQAVRAVGGTGTPTVIINGLRLTSTPTTAQLDSLVRGILRQ